MGPPQERAPRQDAERNLGFLRDVGVESVSKERLIVVCLVWVEGFVLTQKRQEGVHLGGSWEFPGGKVEPDELPAEAAVRELREEAGIPIDASLLQLFHEEAYAYPDRKLHLIFFLVTLRDRPEVSGGFWVAAESLDAERFPPANRKVIAKLKKLARR